MYHRLDKNLLCCNDSVTYCDVDHDLVAESVVDDAEKIANEFGYKKIPVYCDERLDEVLDELDRAWERTTNRINRDENQSFKIKKTKSVRLVANCIIAYNSIILNIVYEQMLAEGVSQELINKFARISPIAWAHIATGKYNFKKSNGEIDITAMVNAFEKHLKQHFWKV